MPNAIVPYTTYIFCRAASSLPNSRQLMACSHAPMMGDNRMPSTAATVGLYNLGV